jgi:[acyl-carrier-protein] S-malonyltransferase
MSVAFLFPGQGSQKVGMGSALAQAYPEARAVYQEADEALGFSLSRLCFEGPQAELTLTANAQPAILATSVAALRVIARETDLRPAVVAGHSLGEYSALVAAQALRLVDAVRVVHLRGKFMQEAVPAGTGAMAAVVGLDGAAVEAVCAAARAEVGGVVSPANLNGGGQVVIAGAKAAVEKASALAKEKGARAIPLQVSAPFHCALMQPAADRLAEVLRDVAVARPLVPVVTNVEAEPTEDPEKVRRLLVEQVTAPVRWEDCVKRVVAMGATRALEVGAGNVLAGLVKRIAPELAVQGTENPEAVQAVTVLMKGGPAHGR